MDRRTEMYRSAGNTVISTSTVAIHANGQQKNKRQGPIPT